MKAKTILTILLLFSFSVLTQAQKAKLQRANNEYEKFNYEVAIPLYLEVLDKIDDPAAKAKLAESYRRTNDWENAEFWYGQIVNIPDSKPVYYLYYGMALQANGKCDLAREWFEEYSRQERDDHRGALLAKACTTDEIEIMINKCNSCYEIQPVPINTKYDDFAPIIYNEGIVFASERDNSGAVKRIHEWTGFPFLELYYTKVDTLDADNYEFTYEKNPKKYKSNVNTKYHDGPVSFSKDNSKVYITRNNYYQRTRGRDDEGVTRLKIFIGDKKGKDWSNLTGLPFNSDEYSVAHPSPSDDGNRLYFSSDMPGGFGGMDLYYTEFESGQWGPPINMGPSVNTEGHEVFPNYHSASGRLYFSSDGQVGLGALDIYYTKQDGETWMTPSNVGAPINSKWDDHSITLNDDETFGYFSSNREGGQGRDDIYSFRKKAIKVEVLVYDEITGEPIPEAEVFISCSKETLLTNSRGKIEIEMPLDECCKFMASKDNYENNELEGCSEGYEPGGKMFLKIPLSYPMAFNLAGLVYDDSTKNPIADAIVQLVNDCDVVERTFTTGLDGRYEFPDLERKCCFTLRVSKDQVTDNNSYMYMANNQTSKACTRDQKISKDFEIDVPLTPIYTFAQNINNPNNPNYLNNPNDANNPSDPDNPFAADPNNLENNPNTYNGIITGAIPTSFIIKHIYYDFDKSYIRDDAEGPLDTLYTILMDNPRYIVEIGSHTDARGSYRYNERLSQRRAKAVVNWLIDKGVDRDRLTYKGYGENNPTNECYDEVPCTEEQHQRNRRTEFRIVGTVDGIRFDTQAESVAPRYVRTDPCFNCPF